MKHTLLRRLWILFVLVVSIATASIAAEVNYSQQSMYRSTSRLSLSPTLLVKNIDQDPLPAQPGETTDIVLRIDNVGGPIKNPRFALVLPSPFTLDTLNDNKALYPSLAAGEKITLRYTVGVNKHALPGLYEAEFRMYLSETSFLPYYFQIKVDEVTSAFDVALNEISQEGVSLAISNTGKNAANAITIRLDALRDFDVLGPPSYILGNLNAGDYTLLNVLLLPKRNITSVEVLNLSIAIDYTDMNGNRRTLAKELPITTTSHLRKSFSALRTALMAESSDTTSTNSMNLFQYTTLVLIVLLIIVIVYYRRKLSAIQNHDA